ncbi:restriction endonuclease subunit S [Arthrobacter sp. FW306-07-I]|uniref:restriction endonuclease subunit S n=1 Tax=Arthrobacter sp. FW306-07-I TaxID=2879622 RepID=UPI00235188D4|nr:restriction endonuclease subunit S [Arthrobacter sp. FW306-07-I]UKA77638.1 restriction endonuclease subunit S [Arthrobacter sp. FW306-07-I]
MTESAEVALQYLVRFRSGQDYKHVVDDEGRVPVIGSGGPFATASSHLYDGESVLFGRKGTVDKPLHVKGRFWTVDTMFYTELSDAIDGRWLYYWATTIPYGLHSTDTAIPSMTSSTLGRLKVPLLPTATQRRMAEYLDRETAKVDAMLRKLGDLAERLRLRRATAGSRLFSMGFENVKLKWLMDEVDIRAGEANSELPLLSVSIHHGVQLREESTSNQRAGADLTSYKVARAGDIVLNRMRAFQGGLGQVHVDGLVSPDYSVLRPHSRLSPAWAEHAMRSPEFIGYMSQRLRGIGSVDQGNVRTPRINVRDLLDLPIPFTSPEEQYGVTSHLDEVIAEIDAMLAKVLRLRELLTEHKSALITDVVTGKKEIA